MFYDGLQKPSFGDDLTSQSDIDFEADPRSLARILENRELSPSATAFMFRSSLTPAVKLHQSLKKNTKVIHSLFLSYNCTKPFLHSLIVKTSTCQTLLQMWKRKIMAVNPTHLSAQLASMSKY